MNHIGTPQQQQHVIKLLKPENLGHAKAICRKLAMRWLQNPWQLEQLLNVASSQGKPFDGGRLTLPPSVPQGTVEFCQLSETCFSAHVFPPDLIVMLRQHFAPNFDESHPYFPMTISGTHLRHHMKLRPIIKQHNSVETNQYTRRASGHTTPHLLWKSLVCLGEENANFSAHLFLEEREACHFENLCIR